MSEWLRVGAFGALLSGCSAVVPPSSEEPPLARTRPEAAVRVSAPPPKAVAPAAPALEPNEGAEAPSEPSPETSAPAPKAEGDTETLPMKASNELIATAREAFVYAQPSRRSSRLGYLRLGARVRRDATPTRGDGCADGWYGVAPYGYVCVGRTASLDASAPVAELARPRPERDDPLPYAYARSKGLPPPLYARLPNVAEKPAENGTPATRRAPGWEDVEDAELPSLLADGKSLPTVFGFTRAATNGPEHAVPNSGFALLSTYTHGGRRFGLTTDLELVPLDQVNRVKASEFHGVTLGEGAKLPVAFVRSRHALLYAGSPERGLSIARPLGFREAVFLSDRSALVGGRRYLETRSGDWLVDAELVRIDPPRQLPPWASGERTWVRVAIGAQTLVAYIGKEPVYATLVSTGIDGMGDPVETRSTPRGEFLVHTKHVTATMNGDEIGDEFDLRDVPYVEYFSGNVAFHAAYWHDAFGVPRSHGCVNLSPIDARWLFHFTEPSVPRGWHGAFSLRDGTLVSIGE